MLSSPWETPQKQTLGHSKPHLNCHKTCATFPRQACQRKADTALPTEAKLQPHGPRAHPCEGTAPHFTHAPCQANSSGSRGTSPRRNNSQAEGGCDARASPGTGGGARSQERSLHTRGQQRNADGSGQQPGSQRRAAGSSSQRCGRTLPEPRETQKHQTL